MFINWKLKTEPWLCLLNSQIYILSFQDNFSVPLPQNWGVCVIINMYTLLKSVCFKPRCTFRYMLLRTVCKNVNLSTWKNHFVKCMINTLSSEGQTLFTWAVYHQEEFLWTSYQVCQYYHHYLNVWCLCSGIFKLPPNWPFLLYCHRIILFVAIRVIFLKLSFPSLETLTISS